MNRSFWFLPPLFAVLLAPTDAWEASVSQNVAVTVTAGTQMVVLSPTSLTFASQNTGTSSTAQAITATNTGTVSFPLSSVAITGANAGDFSQTNTCPSSLAVSATCQINVVFTPTATGTRTASVVVSATGGGTYTATLSGTGAAKYAGLAASFFGMHAGYPTGTWPSTTVGSLGKGACTNWEYVQSSRGTFNWATLDAKVALAAANGVDLFYSNDSVPGWAIADQTSCASPGCGSGAKNCAKIPDNLTDVDNFFAALATRYCGTALKYIELWNEPYMANGAPGYVIPAADLATIATHEYNAIRANCPSMQIITPSMAGGLETYASAYFAAGGPTGVDIVSLHAYVDSSSSNCTSNTPELINLGRYLNSTALHSHRRLRARQALVGHGGGMEPEHESLLHHSCCESGLHLPLVYSPLDEQLQSGVLVRVG